MFKDFISALQNAKSVFITVHVNPDGDALGAMLALKLALEKHVPHLERVDGLMEGKVPSDFLFMPGVDSVRDVTTEAGIPEQYDMAISVDCGSLDRLGAVGERFQRATCSVNMDHHVSNKNFGDININNPTAAASGEVVADLLDEMNIPLDPDVAACVYTALVTDTGGFKYANAKSKTYRLGARCIDTGIDHEAIYKQVFEQRPKAKVKLLREALGQMEFCCDDRISWTRVTRAMRQDVGALEEHTDGIVDVLRSIDTVVIAAVFKESDTGETRVSLRSDDHRIDVAAVVEHFGGGGHKMASGCTINKPLDEAVELMLPKLRDALESVSQAALK